MRYKILARLFFSLLLLLTTLHAASQVALAADDNDDKYSDDDYGYEETARVARVSLIAGDVSLRRAGSDKWERAELNKPLVEGDRLATGADSRVEIQIDARNFIRVGEYATLDIVTLRDAGVALSLPEGTATLRLARFDHDHEYFEIDAPGTTVAAERTGLYRLDVDKDGKVRLAVREGGRARLYSESSGFTLRDGRIAEMVTYGNSNEADWEFSDVRPFDAWDTWVDNRERDLLARLRYDNRDRYYDNQVFGAEELDAYGDWVQTRDYGYVWRPRAATINIYNDWAPYRYGHWDWCPPYGWVWVGDEAWGWAPYHYGRWVYYDNYWCWAPRGYFGYRNRSWWRPALVAFVNVNVSFGNNICWYPLPYHHSDPHSNFWRRAVNRERLSERRREELANLKHLPPIYQHAVSGLPAHDFGRGSVRARPADEQSAKIALATDPVRGRLPVVPVDGEGGMTNLRGRLSDSKRAAIASRGDGGSASRDPLRTFERPTGAAKRLPGTALDDELRRARIFNNREPNIGKGAKGDPLRGVSGGGDPARRTNDTDPNRRLSGDDPNRRDGDNGRSTGAVARPARPIHPPDTNGAGGDKVGGGKSGGEKGDGEKGSSGNSPERRTQPARHEKSDDSTGRGRSDDNGGDKNLSPYEQPARPERSEPRPAMPERERDRSEPRTTPREERRETTPERREPTHERRADPAPRNERSEPRHEERSAPPREERSSPREERSSPPPAREERSAPSKSEERSSPSKNEDRHSEPAKSEPSRGRPPVND